MSFDDVPDALLDRTLTDPRRVAVRACAGGTRLLGVHVITLEGSRQVPVRSAA